MILQAQSKSENQLDKVSGTMLYLLASSSLKDQSRLNFIVDYIANKKLLSTQQLNGIKTFNVKIIVL